MIDLRKIFTAHRVFTLVTVLSGLAAFVSGLVQVLPGTWQNYALIATGLLAKLVATVKFLDGNAKWEATPAGQIERGPGYVNVRNYYPSPADDEPDDIDGADDAPTDITPSG